MDAAHHEQQRRRTAEELQRDHPRWLVVYGIYTQQYVAFPLFDAPPGTVLSTADPGELVRQIQKIEARFVPLAGPAGADKA
jgi:hypothetical protein